MSETKKAKQAQTNKYSTNSVARNAALMTVLTGISRVTGFMRIIALSTIIGGGYIADSYNLANVIPNYIYELVLGGVLSSIIIPIFVEYLTKKSEEEAFEVASIIINVSIITLGLLAFLGSFFSPTFVKVQTALSGAENIKLAIYFFRFFAIQVVFYGLAAISSGILSSYRRFAAPTFAPILNNLLVICTIIFVYGPNIQSNPSFAITSLAIGTTTGVFLLFAVQIPSLFKIGFKYSFIINLKHEAIRRIAKLSLPLFLYVAGNIIPMWVEVGLSWKHRTGITSLQWAWPFFQLPFGVFAVSIVNALFPSLSENISKGNIKEFKNQISVGLRTIGLIMWPASTALFVLSGPIIALTLRHGRFTAYQADLTANVLSLFSLGLFFFAGFYFLLRAFYAQQDTMTPAFISVSAMIFNIIIDFILVNYFEVKGLALGRSLTYFLSFNIIWLMLIKKIGSLDKLIIISNLKFFISSIFMGAITFFAHEKLIDLIPSTTLLNRFFLFSIPAIIGLTIYLIAIVLLKSPEIKLVKNIIARKSS